MPSSAPKTPPRAPALIAAAVLVSAPLSARFEGLRTHPYVDPAGIRSVCYGETERELRTYTPDECMVLLEARQANDYAPAVLKCVPGLAARKEAFAAAIDAAYNAGSGAFCRSPMAARMNAGDWKGGCSAFVGWRVTARGKSLPGLVRRRVAEAQLCRRGGA